MPSSFWDFNFCKIFFQFAFAWYQIHLMNDVFTSKILSPFFLNVFMMLFYTYAKSLLLTLMNIFNNCQSNSLYPRIFTKKNTWFSVYFWSLYLQKNLKYPGRNLEIRCRSSKKNGGGLVGGWGGKVGWSWNSHGEWKMLWKMGRFLPGQMCWHLALPR